MTKEEILNKIIDDLPSKQYRNDLSYDEWYGWFEEAFDEGYKQAQTLQLQQTGVSGGLFSEMNTEMIKISVAMQNIKQSEFIEDYKFHKTTSKKDIKTFLNAIKQQNERLVILNQRMIRLRERFSKNYQ